jgi:hypothetical protein
MTRIAILVTVGSFLASPVVFAQAAEQTSLPPRTTTENQSSRNEVHSPPSNVALTKPKSGVRTVCLPPSDSAVTGSFDDPTVGSPHFGNENPITGSFEAPETH